MAQAISSAVMLEILFGEVLQGQQGDLGPRKEYGCYAWELQSF